MFRNESRVQVRAGQVFSALENVSRTIVIDPKSSAEASCDIGRERRERERERERESARREDCVICQLSTGLGERAGYVLLLPAELAAHQWRAGCCGPHVRQTSGHGHDAKLHRPRLKLRHGSAVFSQLRDVIHRNLAYLEGHESPLITAGGTQRG